MIASPKLSNHIANSYTVWLLLLTLKSCTQGAITLYQQSLELFEKIGDVQGKAATLHCMAIIYANQGKIDEPIALYEQSAL